MNIQVVDKTGAKVKDLLVNEQIWNIAPHNQAIYDTVIAQQASWRQGTHKVKTRAEVSGGGRKPWRQKGTGRARQGSIRAPQWKGGGIVFGPTVLKNYKKSVNKKVRRLALKSVLSLHLQNKEITIIDNFSITNPSTKEMVSILEKLNLNNQKILIVTTEGDETNTKSARNIPKVSIIPANNINVYDLLNANQLLLTESAFTTIEEALG